MFGVANNTEFLQAIGIANAPEDVKSKLIEGIETLAQQKLIIKIADKVTDAQAEEFSKITDPEQAKNWLTTNIPDFPSLVAEVFAEIRDDILAQKTEVMGK